MIHCRLDVNSGWIGTHIETNQTLVRISNSHIHWLPRVLGKTKNHFPILATIGSSYKCAQGAPEQTDLILQSDDGQCLCKRPRKEKRKSSSLPHVLGVTVETVSGQKLVGVECERNNAAGVVCAVAPSNATRRVLAAGKQIERIVYGDRLS